MEVLKYGILKIPLVTTCVLTLTFSAAGCFSSTTLDLDAGGRDTNFDGPADGNGITHDASDDAGAPDVMVDGTVEDAPNDVSLTSWAFSDVCSVHTIPTRSFLDGSWVRERTSILPLGDSFVVLDGYVERPEGSSNRRWFRSLLDEEGNLGEGVELAGAHSIAEAGGDRHFLRISEERSMTYSQSRGEEERTIALGDPPCSIVRAMGLFRQADSVIAVGLYLCDGLWIHHVNWVSGTELVDSFDYPGPLFGVVALEGGSYVMHTGSVFFRSDDGSEHVIVEDISAISALEDGRALVLHREASEMLRLITVGSTGFVEELGRFNIGEEGVRLSAAEHDGDVLVTLLASERVRFGILRNGEFRISEPYRANGFHGDGFGTTSSDRSFVSRSSQHEYIVRCER